MKKYFNVTAKLYLEQRSEVNIENNFGMQGILLTVIISVNRHNEKKKFRGWLEGYRIIIRSTQNHALG